MVKKGFSFNPDTDIPSLDGKVIFITGGNLGLGKQSAKYLAVHNPAEIWIAARNSETGNSAVEEIKQVSPNVLVRFLQLDLGSFDSIKTAAKTFIESVSKLDILMLNAGIMGTPAGVTKDGYETRFGINHVGHALLLKLLTPLLLKTVEGKPAGDVRVVILGSEGHKYVTKEAIPFQRLKSKAENISTVTKYSESKLANVIYAREFAKKYPQFLTIGIDPGNVKTDLFEPRGGGMFMKFLQMIVVPLLAINTEEGAKNQVWASTIGDVVNGEYYRPIGVAGDASANATDDALGKKLWDWTEEELKDHDIE
jgi:retinol dehydrogenase-12